MPPTGNADRAGGGDHLRRPENTKLHASPRWSNRQPTIPLRTLATSSWHCFVTANRNGPLPREGSGPLCIRLGQATNRVARRRCATKRRRPTAASTTPAPATSVTLLPVTGRLGVVGAAEAEAVAVALALGLADGDLLGDGEC